MLKAKQFGSIIVPMGICQTCGERSLTHDDGTSWCCDAPTIPVADGDIKQVCSSPNRRKQLSGAERAQLIEKYGDKCYWCGADFGSYAMNKKKRLIYRLDTVWDHYIPFTFTGSSNPDSFVPSCQFCNRYKHARIIGDMQTEDEVRKYIISRWEANGWEHV